MSSADVKRRPHQVDRVGGGDDDADDDCKGNCGAANLAQEDDGETMADARRRASTPLAAAAGVAVAAAVAAAAAAAAGVGASSVAAPRRQAADAAARAAAGAPPQRHRPDRQDQIVIDGGHYLRHTEQEEERGREQQAQPPSSQAAIFHANHLKRRLSLPCDATAAPPTLEATKQTLNCCANGINVVALERRTRQAANHHHLHAHHHPHHHHQQQQPSQSQQQSQHQNQSHQPGKQQASALFNQYSLGGSGLPVTQLQRQMQQPNSGHQTAASTTGNQATHRHQAPLFLAAGAATTRKGRPLSVSSISSAASSGFSSSANSSASSGVQSLARSRHSPSNYHQHHHHQAGRLGANYGSATGARPAHIERRLTLNSFDASLDQLAAYFAGAGLEATGARLSHHHRNSFTYFTSSRLLSSPDNDEYQSCEEELAIGSSRDEISSTSTASNFDDCSTLLVASPNGPSILPNELQGLDEVSLAKAKRQYRKSLLIEHYTQQQQQHAAANQPYQHAAAPTATNDHSIGANNYGSRQSPITAIGAAVNAAAAPTTATTATATTTATTSTTTRIKSLICSPPDLHLTLLGDAAQSSESHSSESTSRASSSSIGQTTTTHSSSTTSRPARSLAGSCGDTRSKVSITVEHVRTKQTPGYWDSDLSTTQRVVTEIIETERAYVDDLEQIVTGYICYLRDIMKHKQQRGGVACAGKAHPSRASLTASRTSGSLNDSSLAEGDKSSLVSEDYAISSGLNEEDEAEFEEDEGVEEEEEEDDEEEEEEEEEDEESYDLVSLADSLMHLNTACCSSVASLSHSSRRRRRSRQHHHHHQDCLRCHQHAGEPAGVVFHNNHIKRLFSNLEDIYKFNKDLLFRLEECYLNPSSVAECFVENAAGFDVYTHYCTSYPLVVSTLTELMGRPDSAQLLKERQLALKQSLPLGTYLLKPVQRILKYHILFQSLIKYTNEDRSVDAKDRGLIAEAFSVMTSIANHINVMKRKHEHEIRVQELQGILSGWQGPDLTALGELVLEDSFRLYNRLKTTRHLLLFDKLLLITKKKQDGSLSYKGHITCSNLMLIENIEGQPLVFNTVPFNNPKALCAFQAKNLERKCEWCLQIKEVIIKSFEVKIPVHVRDIVMSLTTNSSNNCRSQTASQSPSEAGRAALRTPSYLQKKKRHQDKRK